MPSDYDLPEYQGAQSVEDINKYNKLPYYLAAMGAKRFPIFQTFNQLFGKLNWTPNQGTTLKGVRAEPTPIGQQVFYPKQMTEAPLKDTFETLEVTEQATLQRHKFRSKKFHFLPSFQDFRDGQVKTNMEDMTKQISYKADVFTRSYILQRAPYIYVVGNTGADANVGTTELSSCPNIPSGTTVSTENVAAAGKNADYLKSLMPLIPSAGIRLRTIDRIIATMRDEIGAPFFEGAVNTPKDNELIKGKYVMVGGSELYQWWKYDPDFNGFRNVNLDITTQGFRGSIFDELTFKAERYPLRFDANGLFPAPEIQDANNRTIINPAYIACEYEIAFVLGAESFKTIKVGPPPKEFASTKMSAEKFYSLNWNGEVKLTDNVLVQYSDNSYEQNIDGEYLMLHSHVVYGAMAQDARFCLPVVYKRGKIAKQA